MSEEEENNASQPPKKPAKQAEQPAKDKPADENEDED